MPGTDVDSDQGTRSALGICFINRRAEARLAKHGIEASTGVDLSRRRTFLPMTRDGGTRGRWTEHPGGDSGAPVPTVGVPQSARQATRNWSATVTDATTSGYSDRRARLIR